MYPKLRYVWCFALFFLGACQAQKTEKFEFILLQINDVYEIAPLENGKSGGLARVASLKKELLAQNPNTFMLMAGDFVSPSLIGTLKDSTGKSIKGKQMVECLNAAGLDYATFGNHEFDIDSVSLQNRLDESEFVWTSANVLRKNAKPFAQNQKICPSSVIKEMQNDKGQKLRLGIIGLTLPFNKANFVSYLDFREAARNEYDKIKNQCDVVVALTHLSIGEDQELATIVPEIPLIMGGHEHYAQISKVRQSTITKADANAKTAYVHYLSVDLESKKVDLKSELKKINEQIPHEPTTEKIVQKWLDFAHNSMKNMGFSPENIVCHLQKPLDGRENSIRYEDTNLGKIIAHAFWKAVPNAQAALFNSGSVRVDDQIHEQVSEYDIFRILPYGGSLALVELKGSDLIKILQTGRQKNLGTGGFLQLANLSYKKGKWHLGTQLIEEEQKYQIAMPEFMALGKEANLEFLAQIPYQKPEQLNKALPNDSRKALIDFLKNESLNF